MKVPEAHPETLSIVPPTPEILAKSEAAHPEIATPDAELALISVIKLAPEALMAVVFTTIAAAFVAPVAAILVVLAEVV
jgi:hypothetical protein